MESGLPPDMLQGYGDEGPVADKDGFLYTRKLEAVPDSDEAFLQRLRHMGKTSKQKFALMARRFANKSKVFVPS